MTITLRADKASELTHAEMDTNFIELRDIPTGKTFPNTQNMGVKLDVNTPDFGWHDLHSQIHLDPNGINNPTMTNYIGGVYEPEFSVSNESMVRFHIPHDYAIGTDLFIHVHWSCNSSIVTGGSVTWAFEMTSAKGHDQEAFGATKIISVIQNASIIQHQHMIAETALSVVGGSTTQLNTTNIEPDTLVVGRFYLDSNDIITSNASIAKPFVHMIDLHYQSNGIPTKNRSPDFWT